ncbi:hypothetical protein J6590_090120 [Homalodisca vitripennis]|nr:hypothetical protein J6590_090120 [Homalodisca vitripennis]
MSIRFKQQYVMGLLLASSKVFMIMTCGLDGECGQLGGCVTKLPGGVFCKARLRESSASNPFRTLCSDQKWTEHLGTTVRYNAILSTISGSSKENMTNAFACMCDV